MKITGKNVPGASIEHTNGSVSFFIRCREKVSSTNDKVLQQILTMWKADVDEVSCDNEVDKTYYVRLPTGKLTQNLELNRSKKSS